ncbi:hypothetical protein [Paenibacillus xylanilyticus]|uniref:Uncharacterized protein n=1 Tax=Paenibacillus xylanilyticus TaxID=248903 RepID=A0A7Y6EWX1_9BACL|nr:hypothetical protein [Paenibacillus xylanilyticus]NUU79762.1 hypothetical protein [Paenibacillus xylanilyticus]
MENVSERHQLQSIQSLQSTIRKSENALTQMTQKGANTTLIEKRLRALNIGLSMLENVWHQKPHSYTQEDLTEARNVLTGLMPSIENAFAKSKEGGPQKNLLKRRIQALELAVHAIDDLLQDN